METNLIFKRPVIIDGATKVVTRIVRVSIPDINAGEGWTLSGHTDSIEICEGVYAHPVAPKSIDAEAVAVSDVKTTESDVTKFISNIPGTAKLVRSKGVIRIVARRGKTTYNQTTPNSVCINDFTKNEFFKDCREYHGQGSGIFQFTMKDNNHYDYWNGVIDKEYQRQKRDYEKSLSIH